MKKNKTNSNKNKNEIKKTIFVLLDKTNITKDQIVDQIEEKYNIPRPEIRNIVREIKTDFRNKINVLQSGVIKI